MKIRKLRPIQKRAHRDNRGYTLQTIIVMSILIAAAVGASVVLFRAVSTNTDVRSLTDLAGSNAPSRPHGFSVEKTTELVDKGEATERSVPSAAIRWSPPLYTGQTQLEGTPASVLYKVDYGCADPADSADINDLADITLENIPDSSPDPTDDATTPDVDESKLDTDGPQTHFGDSTELSILDGDITEHSIPERILRVLFPNPTSLITPPDTVYCILQAQAYTCSDAQTEDCANPGDNASETNNALTGREIYSLESEPIRFELSRAPTEILNLEYDVPPEGMTATNNRVDLIWDAPEFTGTGEAFLYEIQWAQRGDNDGETDFDTATIPTNRTRCTVGNAYSLDLKLDADDPPDSVNELIVDIRITSYAVTEEVARNAVSEQPPLPRATPWRRFVCPTKNSDNEYLDSATLDYPNHNTGDRIGFPGGQTDLIDILLTTPPPTEEPRRLTIQNSPTYPSVDQLALIYETIPTAPPAQKIAVLGKPYMPYITVPVRWRVDAGEEENIDSYELQWSRADGSGASGSLSVNKPFQDQYLATPANPPKTLEVRLDLENNRAYNFSFAKKLSTGQDVTTSLCTVISHPLRTPTPEIEVIPRASTASAELLVRIAPSGQERFCDYQKVDRVFTPLPRVTEHYKVRVYNPASSCTGDYPNERCSDVSNQCKSVTTGINRQAVEEVAVTSLTHSTTYEVEVIAGHTCDDAAMTIAIDPPSPPNLDRYGYSSAPITKTVTTPAAPVALTVSATFVAGDDPTNCDPQSLSDCDRWNLSWTEVSGATGYLFTIDHDTSQPTPPDTDAKRYVYTSSSRATSFSARSPVGEFTCSKSGTTITCAVIDDDQASTPPHTNLEFKVWSVSASGISAAADTSPTPSVEP